MNRLKILHIITGLGNGGAEATLFRLCLADKKNQHEVISLMSLDKYGGLLKKNGITVHALNMSQGKFTFSAVIKLYNLIKKYDPDAIQTWMYHADLIGGVVARFAGIKNINWGVHHSNLTPADSKKSTILIAKLCSVLSLFIPNKIIYCADMAAAVHEKIGYKKSKTMVIYNGYDLNLFNIDNLGRETVRAEFGISGDTILLGMVSRFHPFKDHKNLITSLGLLKKQGYKFNCLLVGTDMNPCNKELVEWIEVNNVVAEVTLANNRDDIPMVMNALDIHLLSSSSEAFPNVLSEAMACGTPCLTTDVGDAAQIVGNTGWIVPVKDSIQFSTSLAQAIEEMQENPGCWVDRTVRARRHIVNNFGLDAMVHKYNKAWCKH